ncbi:MAG: hypothetical protein MJZ97_12645 [Bacteroidales bacterium]|nr:hypothetical protein [Bacteroidales bacterium]
MNNFTLSSIHELISFNDVFTSDNEYMKAAGKLTSIKLQATPLYGIETNMAVMFTPKLRYYKILVENEVNRHLNEANALLEADGSGDLTAFVLKKTREAVQTLANDAQRELLFSDPDGSIWQNVSFLTPNFMGTDKAATERVVFMHHVTAELIRCWLELQDRHVHATGTAGLFDIALCYASFANSVPDNIFRQTRLDDGEPEISETEERNIAPCKVKKKVPKKAKQDANPPYTLNYYTKDRENAFMTQRNRVLLVFKKFIEWKWINKDTRPEDFESFFSGKERHCNIKWTATNSILTYLMKTLLEQTYITKQTGCSARSIVTNQFGKNPDNNYSRIDDAAKGKVKITLFLLDISKPLPERRNASGYSTESDLDMSDKALQEVYSGAMHVGKHT